MAKSPGAFVRIEVKHLPDETRSQIFDPGIDLINGRIVEVLVESDRSLGVDGKIVAVPPGNLRAACSGPSGR